MRKVLTTTFDTMNFTGDWLDAIGNPESNGVWIIWGNSGNGKTYFAMKLAKYLATLGRRVAYDSLEEGFCESIKKAMIECGIQEVSRRFILLDRESIADLIVRLGKKKSPQVIFIDSIQYTGLTYAEYKELKSRFRSKLFILLSHADGKHPAGRVAKSIRFDANVKILVHGYQAYAASRYGGGEPYMIWPEGVESLGIQRGQNHETDD